MKDLWKVLYFTLTRNLESLHCWHNGHLHWDLSVEVQHLAITIDSLTHSALDYIKMRSDTIILD